MRIRRFFKSFRYGQKGFTLIELLVVIAILGILAAIAIPNIAKFMGEGQTEAAATELANVQTAVLAGMVDAGVVSVTPGPFSPSADFTIDTGYVLSSYILGGITNVTGASTIDQYGAVTQTDYPAP